MKAALFVTLALAVAGIATAQAPGVLPGAAAANATGAAPPPPANFWPSVTAAAEANSLVAFVAALKDHGLADAVDAKNLTATIFAPSDEAFQKLADSDDDAVQELIADRAKMETVLKYHVVPGAAITGPRLQKLIEGSKGGSTSFATLAGERLNATLVDGAPAINGVPANDTGVQGAKSIIHTIDEVLLPPSLIPEKAPKAAKAAAAASGAAGLAVGAALALPLFAAALL